MKNKRLLITLAIISILVIAGIVGWKYFKSENENPVSGLKPRVEMAIGKISDITDSTVNLSVRMLVHNPLPIGLDIDHLNFKVQMNGKTMVEDKYAKPITIKPSDSSEVMLPAKLKIKKLGMEGDSEAAQGEDSADYHFEAVIYPKKPILGKDSLTFEVDKRLPLYRLPQIELADFDLKKLRLVKDSEVVIRLKVKNRNAFSVQFEDPRYSVDLGKQKAFAGGKVEGVTKLTAGKEDIFEIPLSVDLGKALRAAAQLVTKGNELPFTFYFKSKIVADNDVLDAANLNLVASGTLEDLADVQKNLGGGKKGGDKKEDKKDKKDDKK